MEVPLPGLGIVDGEKLAVTDAGRPEMERDTPDMNDPTMLEATMAVLEPPFSTLRLVGETLRAKLPDELMVNVSGICCVSPPPAPVIVSG